MVVTPGAADNQNKLQSSSLGLFGNAKEDDEENEETMMIDGGEGGGGLGKLNANTSSQNDDNIASRVMAWEDPFQDSNSVRICLFVCLVGFDQKINILSFSNLLFFFIFRH